MPAPRFLDSHPHHLFNLLSSPELAADLHAKQFRLHDVTVFICRNSSIYAHKLCLNQRATELRVKEVPGDAMTCCHIDTGI